MDPLMITVLVVVILLISAGLAFILYKTGFRATEIIFKTGPMEAKMERKLTSPSDNASPNTPASPAQFSQEASSGGVILKADIQAPANSPASARQKATGKGSRLEDSKIKLE